MANVPKPPYDSELKAFFDVAPPADILPEGIEALRKIQNDFGTLEIALSGGEPFDHVERSVTGPGGPITLSIFTPNADGHPAGKPRPGIFQIHSGGLICGNRFTMIKDALRWAKASGAVCVSVEYRLAPENPFPASLDDCWAGLQWVGANAKELGIDPDRLLVGGQSAGGNLSAALAIRARDNKGPKLCGQLLDCGMFDDRMTSVSINQYVKDGTWTRESSVTAWKAILGDKAGKDGVSLFAAVNRATPADLTGLPPAYLSVGSAEGFRDEVVEYAKKLWAAGVQADLHVWPGGYHCFDLLMPDAAVSKASIETRTAWTKKILAEPAAKL